MGYPNVAELSTLVLNGLKNPGHWLTHFLDNYLQVCGELLHVPEHLPRLFFATEIIPGAVWIGLRKNVVFSTDQSMLLCTHGWEHILNILSLFYKLLDIL